jgi:hypothetical protein
MAAAPVARDGAVLQREGQRIGCHLNFGGIGQAGRRLLDRPLRQVPQKVR